MIHDQTERSTERIVAEIVRLQVLNQHEAGLTWALAHMFDELEGPARRHLLSSALKEREVRLPSFVTPLRVELGPPVGRRGRTAFKKTSCTTQVR